MAWEWSGCGLEVRGWSGCGLGVAWGWSGGCQWSTSRTPIAFAVGEKPLSCGLSRPFVWEALESWGPQTTARPSPDHPQTTPGVCAPSPRQPPYHSPTTPRPPPDHRQTTPGRRWRREVPPHQMQRQYGGKLAVPGDGVQPDRPGGPPAPKIPMYRPGLPPPRQGRGRLAQPSGSCLCPRKHCAESCGRNGRAPDQSRTDTGPTSGRTL